MKGNKKSNNIWVYGVILFTSAFLVLLFAGYSQIKLNKNLNSYKARVQNTESEIKTYKQYFASAQEMNEKLNEEISRLNEEINDLKNELFKLQYEKENLHYELDKKNMAEKNFSRILKLYLDGNILEAAALLDNVDITFLEKESAETFKILSDKIRRIAGKILYDEGYSLYKKGEFKEASEKLALSYGYCQDETYSDNCLYYLAYAELKSGNKDMALSHMKEFLDKYPESWFSKLAKDFLERHGE